MIAIDTSALLAVLLREERAEDCRAVMIRESEILISAGTLAEVLIVASGRSVSDGMQALLDALPLRIVPVGPIEADRIATVYRRWGRGFHPARLNFGDCFAYAVAQAHRCPLLYIGNDFARTDIESAL